MRLPKYIEHVLNPLHIFCRLRDLGINPKKSIKIAKIYDKTIFNLLRHLNGIENYRSIEYNKAKCNNNKKNGENNCQ